MVFFDTVMPHTNQLQRRVVAGAVAHSMGRGGKTAVAVAAGMLRKTVTKAFGEVVAGIEPSDRLRAVRGSLSRATGDSTALVLYLSCEDELVHTAHAWFVLVCADRFWDMSRRRCSSSKVFRRAMLASFAVAVLASCVSNEATTTTTITTEPTRTEPTTGTVDDDQVRLDGLTFEVRRDPGCGCCTSWADYLQRHGATVELSEDPERATFRSDLGIDDAAASCHTAIVDGYAIEGHVPASAIQRLLADRPDAIGLALAGMPSDSPGMGGDMTSWAELPVTLVSADGDLSPYDY